MQTLDHTSYLALREGAQVLEADGTGDKVLRLADGSMLKLFRRKRLLSSAAWYPYAKRFADNCMALSQRGIACPRVLQVYRVASIKRDAVHYDPLPGETLRQVIGQPGQTATLREQLGAFIAELHEKGVYFRSAHLGNVVLTQSQHLGLIDIADLRTYQHPLRKTLRLRNFKHMLRYKEDRHWLLDHQGQAFKDGYLSNQRTCNNKELSALLTGH